MITLHIKTNYLFGILCQIGWVFVTNVLPIFSHERKQLCERFQETAASRQDSVLTSTEDNQQEGKETKVAVEEKKSACLIPGT